MSPVYANWTSTRTTRWRRRRRSRHPSGGGPRRLRYRQIQARRPAGLLFGDAMPGDLTTRTATTAISACWSHSMLSCRRSMLKPIPTFSSRSLIRPRCRAGSPRPSPTPTSGSGSAELDGNAAGYLVLRVIRRPPNPFKFAETYGLIDQIGIDPKARRRGLGRALIETARGFLRDHGITRMRAEHWAFNQGAAAFFAGEGLEPLRVNRDGPVDR